MLAWAAAGSPKNMLPVRLRATSNDAGSNGWIWASPWMNAALWTPSCSALDRATSSMREERSMPSAVPEAASRAASRVVWPVPHPMSSTASSGAIAARSSRGRW